MQRHSFKKLWQVHPHPLLTLIVRHERDTQVVILAALWLAQHACGVAQQDLCTDPCTSGSCFRSKRAACTRNLFCHLLQQVSFRVRPSHRYNKSIRVSCPHGVCAVQNRAGVPLDRLLFMPGACNMFSVVCCRSRPGLWTTSVRWICAGCLFPCSIYFAGLCSITVIMQNPGTRGRLA